MDRHYIIGPLYLDMTGDNQTCVHHTSARTNFVNITIPNVALHVLYLESKPHQIASLVGSHYFQPNGSGSGSILSMLI